MSARATRSSAAREGEVLREAGKETRLRSVYVVDTIGQAGDPRAEEERAAKREL
jgi:hypothetical protein